LATTSLMMSSLITGGSRVQGQDECFKLLMLREIGKIVNGSICTVNWRTRFVIL